MYDLTLFEEVDFHHMSSVRVCDGAVVNSSEILLLRRADDQNTSHSEWRRVLQDGIVRVI